MRRAAKRDSNENELIEYAESLGAWWVPLGPLDGFIHYKGFWTPVEIKNPKGKNRLTDSQKSFLAYCETHRAPVFIWRTIEDVRTCLVVSIAP